MRGMAPLRVGVIFGGRSGEHEVSLASAASVIAALEHRGHTVVPIGIGRDGRWVVGGDPLRALASQARVGLPSGDATGAVKKALVESTVVLRREWREGPERVARRVAEVTGFPCFVKPSNLGSSVGISRVIEAAALPAALDEAARHDRKIIVERAVRKPREVEVSVLGNDAPEASLPGEITYDAEWYDYATKYAEGQARITVPAPIGPALTARVREIAVAAFRAIDASGMARVDFFLEGDRVVLNEINTIPGFTANSAYARLWEATGLAYGELIERLIGLALERHRDTRNSS